MKYAKLFFASILFVALVVLQPTISYASSNTSCTTAVEYTDAGDGYYFETYIEDVAVSSDTVALSGTTSYVTKTKTTSYKDSDGNTLYSISITAKFAYDGTTAQCVSYTPKTNVYSSYWSASGLSSVNNITSVSAWATFTYTDAYGSSTSKSTSVSISCTPDGTVY